VSATLSGTSVLRDTDVVWVYNSPATVGIPSAAVSLRGGPPHLMHVMDLWPDSILFSGLAAGRRYQVMASVLRRWCDWTYERAGAIASISRGTLAELARRGVPDAKLHYVPIWTDESQYCPQAPDPALREQVSGDQGFVVLYAGNLGDTQGLDGLLDVCQRTEDIGIRYVLAGSGTAEPRLRATARDRNLKNVSFLGRWPSDDMGRLLAAADVALVSLNASRMAALTMPSKLPAILASGRPVLAWAPGEVARTVREGQCGFVADPGDTVQLERAIRDAYHSSSADLTAMGAHAEELYRSEFSLATGVRALEGLLTELADAARRRRMIGGVVR
jgi:glycosyltransferase involved in cell wall biosynthesis